MIPLAFLALSALAAAGTPAVEWPRIEASLPRAVNGEGALLLEFYKPQCRYCTRLHAEIFADERVATLLARTIRARVDLSAPGGSELAARLRVELFPSLLVVGATGEVIDRYDGLPELSAARAFLERAALRRPAPPATTEQWVAAGDFAATAEALPVAETCYRRAIDAPDADAGLASGARLRLARVRVRRGDPRGAAEALEPFVTLAEAPGPAVRPALDTLVRLRKELGDEAGAARARGAFVRLFPQLPPPD